MCMIDYIKITIRMVQRELDAIGLGGSHFLSSFFLVFLVLTFCSLVMGALTSTFTDQLHLWLSSPDFSEKSMTTVISITIALISKNSNCRLRKIHIFKCSVPKLFWNLKPYKWSHKRFKTWYFASSEGLCVDLLEVLLPLWSILEATSRNQGVKIPHSVTIKHCHIKCSKYKVLWTTHTLIILIRILTFTLF